MLKLGVFSIGTFNIIIIIIQIINKQKHEIET